MKEELIAEQLKEIRESIKALAELIKLFINMQLKEPNDEDELIRVALDENEERIEIPDIRKGYEREYIG